MEGFTSLYETRTMLQDLLYEAANFMAYEGKLTRQEFDKITAIDPTPTKTYAKWLLIQYLRFENPDLKKRFFEDDYKIKEALEIFDKLKRRKIEGINIDIMTYKSLDSLYNVTDQYIDKAEELEAPKAERDIVRVWDDEHWSIVIPRTFEASCTYGANTRWCTTMRDNSGYFDRYSKQGPLVIIIDKTAIGSKRNAKWQFHIGSSQYMDAQDRSVGEEGVVKILEGLPAGAQSAMAKLGYNKETFELMHIFEHHYGNADYSKVNSEKVKRLIAAGGNPHIHNEAILKWAIKSNEAVLVDVLIKDPLTDRTVLGDLITSAAEAKNLAFVEKLVQAAGSEALNANGGKALIAACKNGDLTLIQYFAKHGADLNASRGEPLAVVCTSTAPEALSSIIFLLDPLSLGKVELIDVDKLTVCGLILLARSILDPEALAQIQLDRKKGQPDLFFNPPLSLNKAQLNTLFQAKEGIRQTTLSSLSPQEQETLDALKKLPKLTPADVNANNAVAYWRAYKTSSSKELEVGKAGIKATAELKEEKNRAIRTLKWIMAFGAKPA